MIFKTVISIRVLGKHFTREDIKPYESEIYLNAIIKNVIIMFSPTTV